MEGGRRGYMSLVDAATDRGREDNPDALILNFADVSKDLLTHVEVIEAKRLRLKDEINRKYIGHQKKTE